jgi:hypothetical protein
MFRNSLLVLIGLTIGVALIALLEGPASPSDAVPVVYPLTYKVECETTPVGDVLCKTLPVDGPMANVVIGGPCGPLGCHYEKKAGVVTAVPDDGQQWVPDGSCGCRDRCKCCVRRGPIRRVCHWFHVHRPVRRAIAWCFRGRCR